MKPTHRLRVLNKTTNGRTEVGAGWLNNDSSITIVINPMVLLRESKEHVITLFPVTEKMESAWSKKCKEAYEQGPLMPEAGS